MKSYFVIGASFRNSSTLVKLDKNLSEIYRNDFNRELKGRQLDQFFMLQNKMLVLATGKYSRSVFFSNKDVPTAMPRFGSVSGDGMYIVGKNDRLMGKTKIAVARITVN